jgi:hypothetical protein
MHQTSCIIFLLFLRALAFEKAVSLDFGVVVIFLYAGTV